MEIFTSKAAAEARISTFERKTKSSFVSTSSNKTFGALDWRNTDRAQKKALYWKIPYVPFDGVPFLTLGRKVLACHQGKSKTKSVPASDQVHDHSYWEGQSLFQSRKKVITKKVGCPAQIQIHHVIKFPEYQVEKNSSVRQQKVQMRKLREVLLTGTNLKVESVFYVDLPPLSAHSGHPTDGIDAGKREKPDPLVRQEIMNLTRGGVRKLSEMKRHINTFVRNVFEEEEVKDTSRRRFHPLDKDIRNVMDKTKTLMRHAKENQENLGCLMDQWPEREPGHPDTHSPPHIKGGDDSGESEASGPEEQTGAGHGGLLVPKQELPDDCEEKIYINLPPQNGSRKQELRNKCACLLKQMVESVHQLKDLEYLEELYNDLHCKLIEVQLRTPFEVVIEVGSSPQKKRTKGEEEEETPPKKKKT